MLDHIAVQNTETDGPRSSRNKRALPADRDNITVSAKIKFDSSTNERVLSNVLRIAAISFLAP